MYAAIHSWPGRIAILLLVLVLLFAAVGLIASHGGFGAALQALRMAAAAIITAVVIGLAVSFRGKDGLPHPWDEPQITAEETEKRHDDMEMK